MTTASSDLAGKAILVTGASSGIGAATALALGRAGARVALAARRRAEGEALAERIRSEGGEAIFIATDINREGDIRQAVETAVGVYGRLDGAFNNAGALGPGSPFTEQDDAAYDEVMNTNVRGVLWSMRHEIPAILAAGGGAIVNNASVVASVGFPQLAIYTASKHAVVGLTRAAALEYFPRGLRINSVSPGVVATPMSDLGFGAPENRDAYVATTPAGRAGRPEEIAAAVLFLLSGQASFISGHDLVVDGGFTAQ